MSDDNYIQRARDVEALVKEHGVERGIYKAVMRIAEDNTLLRMELKAVVKVTDKMADIVADISTVGAKLKIEFDRIQRNFHPDNEADPSQKWKG
jgi:hypothetical protein